MKLYNRTEFLKLPANVFFIKWFPTYPSGQLCIKGDTMGNDFVYSSTADFEADDSEDFCDKFDDAFNNGKSLINDFDGGQRDGLFEDDAIFMVYEYNDTQRLSHLLDKAVTP